MCWGIPLPRIPRVQFPSESRSRKHSIPVEILQVVMSHGFSFQTTMRLGPSLRAGRPRPRQVWSGWPLPSHAQPAPIGLRAFDAASLQADGPPGSSQSVGCGDLGDPLGSARMFRWPCRPSEPTVFPPGFATNLACCLVGPRLSCSQFLPDDGRMARHSHRR